MSKSTLQIKAINDLKNHHIYPGSPSVLIRDLLYQEFFVAANQIRYNKAGD